MSDESIQGWMARADQAAEELHLTPVKVVRRGQTRWVLIGDVYGVDAEVYLSDTLFHTKKAAVEAMVEEREGFRKALQNHWNLWNHADGHHDPVVGAVLSR